MEREIPLSERKGRAASNRTGQHPVEYYWTLRDAMDRNWRVLHGRRTQSVVLWTGEEETAWSWFHWGQEDCKSSVLECTPVSERIISIRVASKPFNTTITQVYAPTCYYEDPVVEEFYDDLKTIINKTPKKDILIVMGNWNAQIGAGEKHKAAGKFGYGKTSERGTKLLEFMK